MQTDFFTLLPVVIEVEDNRYYKHVSFVNTIHYSKISREYAVDVFYFDNITNKTLQFNDELMTARGWTLEEASEELWKLLHIELTFETGMEVPQTEDTTPVFKTTIEN